MLKELTGAIIIKADADTGGAPGQPSTADLAKIRPYSLTTLDPTTLYVRRLILANDAVDRQDETFPLPILQRIAVTIPGKSLLVNHQKDQLPLGLFFDAVVRRAEKDEAGDHVVEAAFYMIAKPENLAVRQDIDAGVIRYCSVGCSWDEKFCSVCGDPWDQCPHMRGQVQRDGRRAGVVYGGDPARYEAKEGSLVYLGAQHGARIRKEDGEPMEEIQKLAAAFQAHEQAFQERLAGLEAFVREALTPKPAEKKADDPAPEPKPVPADTAKVADGDLYREDLKQEITKLAELVDAAAEARLLLAALPQAPAAALKEIRDSYAAKVDKLLPPSPTGRPAGTEGDAGDAVAALRPVSVL